MKTIIKMTAREKLGYDAGKNGPNMENCNFAIFDTPEHTEEWERGNERALLERKLMEHLESEEVPQ